MYKDIWGAVVGEELECIRERDIPRGAYATAVVKERLSAICRAVSPAAVQCVASLTSSFILDITSGEITVESDPL